LDKVESTMQNIGRAGKDIERGKYIASAEDHYSKIVVM